MKVRIFIILGLLLIGISAFAQNYNFEHNQLETEICRLKTLTQDLEAKKASVVENMEKQDFELIQKRFFSLNAERHIKISTINHYFDSLIAVEKFKFEKRKHSKTPRDCDKTGLYNNLIKFNSLSSHEKNSRHYNSRRGSFGIDLVFLSSIEFKRGFCEWSKSQTNERQNYSKDRHSQSYESSSNDKRVANGHLSEKLQHFRRYHYDRNRNRPAKNDLRRSPNCTQLVQNCGIVS